MKIFLIGYMGSGKSTLGKKLANQLGYAFIDQDKLIEDTLGKSIHEIFEEEGESYFRETEHSMLISLLEKDNVVISTGGGTPFHHNNMELMNQHGLTIYLKMSADTLLSRLRQSKDTRPLISGKSEEDLYHFILTHLEDREPFYAEAQYKVKAKDLDVKKLASFIQGVMQKPVYT
ncbi:MAG TPA: shikimate kinase [Bacteroidia bacterium]|nr:shikimate kinase [Bacteroidia bacterium]